jgi:competence protein ComEA
MRGAIRDYLTFSKKERIGIVLILAVVVIVAAAPAFFTGKTNPADTASLNRFRSQVALLSESTRDSATSHRFSQSAGSRNLANSRAAPDLHYTEMGRESRGAGSVLFDFDPNTLDLNGWLKLGVREKTAKTIGKYLASGGQFRQPADLLRIYGLSEADKKRLLPFVKIAASRKSYDEVRKSQYSNTHRPQEEERDEPWAADENTASYHKKRPRMIEINAADTADWSSLPGIGPVLSRRIVTYRERLGGFYDVRQVGETYGLPDSVFQTMKPYLRCAGAIQQINVNEVTPDDLGRHPYLKRQIARAIVDYRTQHGTFKTVADIKQVMVVTPELFDRISPYLRL